MDYKILNIEFWSKWILQSIVYILLGFIIGKLISLDRELRIIDREIRIIDKNISSLEFYKNDL